MALLRVCCCGCKLTTGCIIIACLSLSNDGICIIRMLVAGKDWEKNMTAQYGQITGSAMSVILPMYWFIDTMCSIALIFGTLKRQPACIIPWLTSSVMFVIILLAGFVVGWVMGNLYLIVVTVVGVGCWIYFTLVVHSFYDDLKTAPIIVT